MLNKIKNILKIIISILIIFSCMKSCAKASELTNQFDEQMQILETNGVVNTGFWTQFSKSYSNGGSIAGVHALIDRYGNYAILKSGSDLYIVFPSSATRTEINNYTNDTSSSLYNSWTTTDNKKLNLNGYSLQSGNFNFNSLTFSYGYTTIAINTRSLVLGAGEEFGGSYLTSPFSFEIATNYSIRDYKGYGQTNAFKYSYNNNQWLLGTMQGLEDITEVEFKLINLETNQNIAQCYKTGSISNMRISNNQLLLDSYIVYRDTPYRLYYDVYIDGDITDSFWYNIVFLNRNAVITNGEITNYGSGEDYNLQNQTQQEQNFWQETYEKLFTISGDFVNKKFEDIKQTLNLSGDYETEQAFINLINENNGDFVIGWQSFSTPYFSLSGDSINFSQLERDNVAFQETMRLGTCINRFQPNSIVNKKLLDNFINDTRNRNTSL